MFKPRKFLLSLFEAAIAAADPALTLFRHLPLPPKGRVIVVGAGKAAASMARAVEECWPGTLTGLVVTRHGYAAPTQWIEVIEAGHPMPDEAGLAASQRTMAMVSGLTPDDLVLCLVSGGGSALLPLPLEGVTLTDKQSVSPRAPEVRRDHQRDQLRPPPSVRHQGWKAGGRVLSGKGRDAADLGHSGR